MALHDIHPHDLTDRTAGGKNRGMGRRPAPLGDEDGGSPEPGRLVTDFAMDRGSIGEYLMEEVLSPSRPVQELLIYSSICDPVSGPLADAICEGDLGSSILGELASKNCFVMALDHQGHRFRYHPAAARGARHLLNREPAAIQRRSTRTRRDGTLPRATSSRHFSTRWMRKDWSFCTNLLIRGAFAELYLRGGTPAQWDRTVRGCAQHGPDQDGDGEAGAHRRAGGGIRGDRTVRPSHSTARRSGRLAPRRRGGRFRRLRAAAGGS